MTCPIRVIYEHQDLYRVALMTLIDRNPEGVKFLGINYRGNFDPNTDLEFINGTYHLTAVRTMYKNVMEAGFRLVEYNPRTFSHSLPEKTNMEEFLVKEGNKSIETTAVLMDERFKFERGFARRVAKSVLNILNQYCSKRFYNGPSILMGQGLLDLAIIQASYAEDFIETEFKQSAQALGGAAHGSQFNTRVAYMNALGHAQYGAYENALNHQEFEYFDAYVYDVMESYLRDGIKCPTTTFTHDFGAVYSNLMTVVGECQSGPMAAEDLKLTLGACRILNYRKTAYALLLTDTKLKIMQFRRADEAGEVQMRDFIHEYCQRASCRTNEGKVVKVPRNRWEYMRGIEKAIIYISRIMQEMERDVETMPELAGNWDYAPAARASWRPGKVPRFYYEFYRGGDMMDRYPEILQEAVQFGEEDFRNAQVGATGDGQDIVGGIQDDEDDDEAPTQETSVEPGAEAPTQETSTQTGEEAPNQETSVQPGAEAPNQGMSAEPESDLIETLDYVMADPSSDEEDEE